MRIFLPLYQPPCRGCALEFRHESLGYGNTMEYETMNTKNEPLDRDFIPALREGVEIVKMIFFMKIRDRAEASYPDEDRGYFGMLAGAVVNDFFGTPNPEPRFKAFASDNRERIDSMLCEVPEQMESMCIPLTDALRVQFLCDHQEGLEDGSGHILKRARDKGILIEERSVPLPKQFMNLAYQIGKAHGIVRDQGQ